MSHVRRPALRVAVASREGAAVQAEVRADPRGQRLGDRAQRREPGVPEQCISPASLAQSCHRPGQAQLPLSDLADQGEEELSPR